MGDSSAFRGHAFSFLVAVSVLFGSMFVAHSAIVKLASLDAAEVSLRYVEEVRSLVASIPKDASQRMAAASLSYAVNEAILSDASTTARQFSFKSGVEDLFAPYISLVAAAPEARKVPMYAANSEYIAYIADSGVAHATKGAGDGALSVGVFIRDAGTSVLPNLAALSVGIGNFFITAEEVATAAYVKGVYEWVVFSHELTRSIVLSTYFAGDTLSKGAAAALPVIEENALEVSGLWVAVSHELALMVVDLELLSGTKVLNLTYDVREASTAVQTHAGGRFASMALYAADSISDTLGGVPQTATAAVVNFLTLQEKR